MSFPLSLEVLYRATRGANRVHEINRWAKRKDHGLTWYMKGARRDFAMPMIESRILRVLHEKQLT